MRTPVRSAVLDPHRVAAAHRAASVAVEAGPGLARLVALAQDLLQASAAVVTVVDDTSELLAATAGLPAQYDGVRVPVEHALCTQLVQSGQPLEVVDLAARGPHAPHPELARLGLRSYAGAPLLTGGHVVGGMCVLGREPRRWTPHDRSVLGSLAAAAETELGLRTSVQKLLSVRAAEQRLLAEQAALTRVATAVARGDAPEDVLQAVASEVAGLVEGEVVLVRFERDGRAEVVAQSGAGTSTLETCAAPVAQLRRTGRVSRARLEGRSCTAAPLTAEGRLWGALVALTDGGPDAAPSRLETLAGLVSLGIANAQAQDRLLELSRTDALTGAPNRRAFEERLAEELERARRHGTPITLVVLDVDHFKQLNDEHGHVTGDRVLSGFVARVLGELRTGDLLARLGGDEFALVLPDTGEAAAAAVVDRVRQALAEQPVAGVRVTTSCGAAVLAGPDVDAEDLYRRADQALYRAKAGGRNAVELVRAG